MAFDPQRLIDGFGSYGHGGLVGLRYRDHGDDWAELELAYREAIVGDAASGIIASGPIFTMMDMATSVAIWIKRGVFTPQATLDLRVDYLRAAEPGKTLIGRGTCYRLTRSIGFVRGEAHDGDPARPVASVAGSFMFSP